MQFQCRYVILLDDQMIPFLMVLFSFPFWQTDILSSLDLLSRVGFSADEENIADTLQRVESRHKKNGLFYIHLIRGADKDLPLWINLAICRVYKRLF